MRRFRRQRRQPAPTTDRRPPEQRLEAMVREKNEERRWRMFARIRSDVDTASDVVPWLNGLSTLRDRLIVSEDETYFLAEIFAESSIFGAQGDPELDRFAAELKAIEAAHGLADDESYYTSDAPDDWSAVNAASDAHIDNEMAKRMREAGLGDIAAIFVDARAKFDERASEGRRRILPDAEDALFD